MTSIRDLQSEEDMVELRECELSIILMMPEWSIYPKKTLRTLESILSDLVANGIRVFTVTEDDPAKNRPFFNWFSEHDRGSLGLVSIGSGGLIICRRGNPIHFEVSTSSRTAEELRTIILKAIRE